MPIYPADLAEFEFAELLDALERVCEIVRIPYVYTNPLLDAVDLAVGVAMEDEG